MTVYIDFSEQYAGPKKITKEWHVVARVTRTILGEIKWHAPWRRYAFFPAITHQCLFDAACLTEIVSFLERQTFLQKQAANERRAERNAA